ncbi:MAG: GspH/FimT family pseudopilin [candidate division Zixibacteria bacterium]|nr:GspH/FimT family pseudopilin [candidate division Zixibacteria bacterium]
MNRIKNHKQAGFTMLEMMIVVVIIGITASMAAPSFFDWIPNMKLKGEAKQNLNYLRQARSKAVAENNQYGVYFDVDNKQLYFFKDTHQPSNAIYSNGADSLIEGPIDMESNFEYSDCTFNNNTVIFFSDGSASTSGSIDIERPEQAEYFIISLLAATGKVKLERSS